MLLKQFTRVASDFVIIPIFVLAFTSIRGSVWAPAWGSDPIKQGRGMDLPYVSVTGEKKNC